MGFTGSYVKVYQSNGDGVKNRKRSRKMHGQGLLYCKPLFSQHQCFICSVLMGVDMETKAQPMHMKAAQRDSESELEMYKHTLAPFLIRRSARTQCGVQ